MSESGDRLQVKPPVLYEKEHCAAKILWLRAIGDICVAKRSEVAGLLRGEHVRLEVDRLPGMEVENCRVAQELMSVLHDVKLVM